MSRAQLERFDQDPVCGGWRAKWKCPAPVAVMAVQFLLLFLFCGERARADDVVLDETWTLSVGGQTVQANPDGSFMLGNIAAPDLFGPGGPGTRPDFLSDDFMRLVGFSAAGGVTRYVFSDPFQIRQGQPFVVTNLTLTLTPPPFPESLAATADVPTLTKLGQTTQVHVMANLVDGSTMDVTPRTAWTVYRTSNPSIVTVDGDGRITAAGPGKAFVTAVNASATAVVQIDVSLGDPLTTITGLVLDRNGAPVQGVTLSVIGLGGSAVSGPDGSFSIPGVATAFDLKGVMARASSGGVLLLGVANRLKAVPGGLTDSGIIRIASCTQLGIDCLDTDGDGLPDSIELSLGLNPRNQDSDGNGVPDGAEDYDHDGLSNLAEIILGTNPKIPDTDGDGLSDGAEVYQYGTNPLKWDTDQDGLSDGDEIQRGTNPLMADSDGDGWNDESEVTAGSNPLDPNSTPSLMLVAAPRLSMVLPEFSASGAGSGLTVAQPVVRLGLTGSGPNVTLGLTVSEPVVKIGLTGVTGVLGLTVAQPPLKTKFLNP